MKFRRSFSVISKTIKKILKNCSCSRLWQNRKDIKIKTRNFVGSEKQPKRWQKLVRKNTKRRFSHWVRRIVKTTSQKRQVNDLLPATECLLLREEARTEPYNLVCRLFCSHQQRRIYLSFTFFFTSTKLTNTNQYSETENKKLKKCDNVWPENGQRI